MAKLSHLISLPVINIYEVRLEGTIENVLINPTTKKVEFLIIYDEESDIKKVIPFNKIYAINEQCLLIKNNEHISLFESVELQISKFFNPINSNVYYTNGVYKGIVNDVTITGNKLEAFIINNESIVPSKILNFNQKLTLLKEKDSQKVSTYKIKKKILTTNTQAQQISEQKVSVLSPNTNSFTTPKKAIVNYNFLLNRKVIKDIYSTNGQMIVKKDAIITLAIINTVKQFGKLKELTLFSK